METVFFEHYCMQEPEASLTVQVKQKNIFNLSFAQMNRLTTQFMEQRAVSLLLDVGASSACVLTTVIFVSAIMCLYLF